MNILWVKDNNIGHEKQVKVLLDEIAKNIDLNIDQRSVKGFFPFRYVENIFKKKYDLIIGAGHKTYSQLLRIKKYQKKNTKTIAVLSPSFNKNKFDIICAPFHDKEKFINENNVIFFEGSLAKVSDLSIDENTVVIAIGGKNNHYIFDENHLLSQIEYFIAIHSNKSCYIFNSRRTPNSMNYKLKHLKNKYENTSFLDINDGPNDFENMLNKASSKLITRDSVNMIFESLSCKGKTYLLDMLSNKNSNKVVMTVNKLIKNKNIGYIENGEITKGITKMKLHNQNAHYEVFAEVEKVAYEINKRL